MYYFDDKTGLYKKRYRISFSSISIIISLCFFFIALIYFDRQRHSLDFEKLQQENKQLTQAFNVINEELQKNRKLLHTLQTQDEFIYRSILLSDNVQKNDFKLNKISAEKYEINLQTTDQNISYIKRALEELNYDMLRQGQIFSELQRNAIIKKNVWSSRPAILPVKSGRATSGFGVRRHPIYKTLRRHNGIDIANKIGTPVIVTGDGVVKSVGSDMHYGIYVKVNHGFGYETLYAHLDSTNMTQGKRVKRGQIIGRMGNTGISTGSHVHYEVRKNGKPVNPISYIAIDISPKEYEAIMQINNSQIISMD